jgi:cell division protein FtsA
VSYFKLNTIYTVIDIGTTKICTIIAQKNSENGFEILGIGISNSEGLSGGMVNDIDKTVKSIKKSMQEAQTMANFEPDSAYIGISGSHIKSYFSHAMVPIKTGIIRQETIEEAILSCKSIVLQDDQEILHIVPVNYMVDSISNIQNPLGMHGVRLEIVSHIITANTNAMQDLVYCCSLAGIKVQNIVLEPIASGNAILNENEKELGALLVDIGGGTSDLALYKKGNLNYTEIFPVAGRVFTNDLAVCLRISYSEAERIKKEFGIFDNDEFNNKIIIKNIDGINISEIEKSLINDILYARAIELINDISNVIKLNGSIYSIPSGIILTGGGALLKGLKEITEKTVGIPVRIGVPNINFSYKGELEHPSYATAYGLLIYAIEEDKIKSNLAEGSIASKLFWKVRSWVNKFFK